MAGTRRQQASLPRSNEALRVAEAQVEVASPDYVVAFDLQPSASGGEHRIIRLRFSKQQALDLMRQLAAHLPADAQRDSGGLFDWEVRAQRDDEWVASHQGEIRQYSGQWVAVYDGRIVAHDEDSLALMRRAQDQGYPDALCFQVDAGEMLLG